MKRDAKRRRPILLLALPGLLATGCAGFDEGRVCTQIGAETGVNVHWVPADFAGSAEAGAEAGSGSLVARLCAQGVCESRTVAKDSDQPTFSTNTALDEDIGEVTVPVRFTVTSGDDGGRVLFDERTDVALHKSQPNGEGCSPTVFQASITADPERGLIAYRS
jgi:hypothetical protein